MLGWATATRCLFGAAGAVTDRGITALALARRGAPQAWRSFSGINRLGVCVAQPRFPPYWLRCWSAGLPVAWSSAWWWPGIQARAFRGAAGRVMSMYAITFAGGPALFRRAGEWHRRHTCGGRRRAGARSRGGMACALRGTAALRTYRMNRPWRETIVSSTKREALGVSSLKCSTKPPRSRNLVDHTASRNELRGFALIFRSNSTKVLALMYPSRRYAGQLLPGAAAARPAGTRARWRK